jgi:FlaA1/EpsC-like NDP-sugar epimerase
MRPGPRFTRLGKTVSDLVAVGVVFWLAFLIRFEGAIPAEYFRLMINLLPAVILIKFAGLVILGVPKQVWKYVSLGEALRIFTALSLATIVFLAWRLTAGTPVIPIGVLLIDLLLCFLVLTGMRASVRLWQERQKHWTADDERWSLKKLLSLFRSPTASPRPSTATLLIGAGYTGALVAKEIASNPGLGIDPKGFLDDDPGKAGMVIHGVKVLGDTAHIAELAARTGAKQALISITNTTGTTLRRLALLCENCGITPKIIPELAEIIGGKVNLSAIRKVAVEDLLRRDPVSLDTQAINEMVKGRTVLITGAGGSIGSELCRVVCRFEPETLVFVEKAENNLFHIHGQLLERFAHINLIPCIADIGDGVRMSQILAHFRPSVLFHAAAHKHVPLMEKNPGEAIKNNVCGTRTLADLAHEHGVGVFVMISTDKAVNPSSIMGVSKRVAELYIQALSQRSQTRFVAVRFGNVLGSNGSVIPIFQDQIARGVPVTVTHPEMRRYFMTIPEACQLVLQAASMGSGGEIFILDMGEPIKIVDLARDLIRLSGLSPDKDVEIRFTGIRPGEKLYEELFLGEEEVRKTYHPRIFTGQVKSSDWLQINRQVQELGELATWGDPDRIRAKFKEIVPEYQDHDLLHDDRGMVGKAAHLVGRPAQLATNGNHSLPASSGAQVP